MKRCFRKLSFSALKRNPAFSAGLFVLFILIAAVSAMSSSLRVTVPGSVDAFIEDGNMPDGWIASEAVPATLGAQIEAVTNVKSAIGGVILPAQLTLASGEMVSPGIFSLEEGDLRNYYYPEMVPGQTDLTNVYLSAYFAEKNGVRAGDVLTLKTPSGDEEVFTAGMISIPETMYCLRSETSFNDTAGYGYVFMDRCDADRLFGCGGIANYWSLRLEDGLSVKEQENALDEAASLFGGSLISTSLYETSKAKSTMDDMMDTIRRICDTFPPMIYGAGLFFMFLFVSQVIRDRRKDIGILIALGYSRKTVFGIFLRYNLILLIPAVVIGTAGGFLVTVMASGLLSDMYYLPRILYRLDIPRYILMILAEMCFCVIACAVSTFLIVNDDPSMSLSGGSVKQTEPPGFFRKLRMKPLVKYSTASLFRNRQRAILSILSIAVCIALSTGSLEYYIAFSETIPRVFGNRYTYDALIGVNNGRDGIPEIENTDGISAAEPVLSFMSDAKTEDRSMRVKVSAIPEDSALIIPYTADYKRIPLSEGVVMDEWTARQLEVESGDTVTIEGRTLTVTGICRNLTDRTEYITFDTAAQMGYAEPDTIAVQIAEDADRDAVLKELTDTSCYVYTTLYDKQLTAQKDSTALVRLASMSIQITALLMGMIIVMNMISLSIRERKHEFAVLLALGVSDRKLTGTIALENLVILIVASIPALPASWFGSDAINRIMSTPTQVEEMFGFGAAFGIAVLLALLYLAAGIYSGFRKLRRIDPALALEEE